MSLLHCFQLSTCQTQLANNRMFCFFTQCPNFYGIWVVQTQKHSSAVSLKNTLLTKTASTQCLFNPVFPRYTIPLTVCHMYCGADRRIEICSDHDYISPVCLPGHVLVKLWLSTTSSKERERETHTHTHTHPHPHTHRRWAHPPARHSLIPPFEPCWVLWYGTPYSANFSVCLSGCGQQKYSTLRSHFTEADSCERMCEKTNHWKPHPVKHGMWIHVPCILAHHVLIGKGCGFERSVEECEGMA